MSSEKQLRSLLLLAVESATLTVPDIAKLSGYSPVSLSQDKYQYLLPAYGQNQKKSYRRWPLLDYWAWISIPEEQRKQTLQPTGPIPKQEILRLHNERKSSSTAAAELLGSLDSDARRTLELFREHLGVAMQCIAPKEKEIA